MKSKRFRNINYITILILLSLIFLSNTNEFIVYAEGLVDETINTDNIYSMYPLRNYQLDFYVDNSWGWLPWNWSDGIGKSVQYGLYCITNFLWIISLYLSNATGYVVQEAYKLDFINDMADAIGKSIQTIAGVNQNGFSNTGFYIGFLLLLILVVGVYVTYIGLIKRETSKAISALVNFIVVFIVSASCIAYAPDYIKKVNEFSSDISKAALTLGTDIIISDSKSEGKDSIDLIRDNLFSIQVKQPWLLLQYGNSNIKEIGVERVEKLLSISPSENDGKDREEIVKQEIEENGNNNLTIPEVINRLGMVFFLLIFNLGITIFIFLLVSMMIFSQILFIIFAIFLPISFLLSMIPSYESMGRKAIVKLFNTIMMRAGITLIITISFSISTMFYTISKGYPFFMVSFLQIVTFAGIYFKLGDIMGMFSLQSGDSQSIGRYIFRKPYVAIRNRTKNLERGIRESFRNKTKYSRYNSQNNVSNDRESVKRSFGKRIGNTVGSVMDIRSRIDDKSKQFKEDIQSIPTQAEYAVYNVKEKVKENISDVKRGIVEERENRQDDRKKMLKIHRESIATKRDKLDNIGAFNKKEFKNKDRKSELNNDESTLNLETIKYKTKGNIRDSHQASQKKRGITNLKDYNVNQFNNVISNENDNREEHLKKELINTSLSQNSKRKNYKSKNVKQLKNKTINKNNKVKTK